MYAPALCNNNPYFAIEDTGASVRCSTRTQNTGTGWHGVAVGLFYEGRPAQHSW